MEFFHYNFIVGDCIDFYVTTHENVITVTTSSNINISRKENIDEFSWGVCLQNIVLFSVTLFGDLNFALRNTNFKSKLQRVLHRIKQFEKVGNIELSKAVLVLFLNEFFELIQAWFLFSSSLANAIEQIEYLVHTSVGLLCTFHILYFHVVFKSLA